MVIVLSIFIDIGDLSKMTGDLFNVAKDRILIMFQTKRWGYWYYVLLMAMKNPLGVGLGNFSSAAIGYIPTYYLYIEINQGMFIEEIHAENVYLTELIETGWLGFVAFSGLVILSVYKSFKSYQSTIKLTHGHLFGAFFGACLCTAITMIASYGFNNDGIAMFFWILIGFTMALDKLTNIVTEDKPILRKKMSMPRPKI